MLIFIEQLVLLIFLWMLRLIDGIMELFTAVSGVSDVKLGGNNVNIIETVVSDNTVNTVFWCIFILAIGLSCIFAIVSIIKNMINGNKRISSIIGKLGLSILGTVAMLAVVVLGILITNSTLTIVSEVFQLSSTTKLSNQIFNACVGDWLNGYSLSEIDITKASVHEIFGDYNTAVLGIWPTSWKCNGMVNPNTFLYLPSLVASIAVMIALLIAVINLAKRIYEIVFMYLVMPFSMSTLPLDDGARFKIWRESFISKIVLAYGAVFSVNIFVLILPILNKMQVNNISGFGQALFYLFMIIGGALMIPAGQQIFVRLFGNADDLGAGSNFMRSAFYGSRIVGGAVIGTTKFLSKGVIGIGKTVAHKKNKDSTDKNDSSSDNDKSDKYTEKDEQGGYSFSATYTDDNGSVTNYGNEKNDVK